MNLYCLLAVSLSSLILNELSEAVVTVTVDPVNGNDFTCQPVQELSSSSSAEPCKTLNRALGAGNVPSTCNDVSCESGAVNESDGIVIILADGDHNLTACIGITQSVNIRFEAANEGHATINCASDLSTSNHTYGGIFFCESQNVSFSGIQFERCGPYSSNVFFNASSEIIFTNSVFRKNSGSPLQFWYSTRITLQNCNFTENVNIAEGEQVVEETQRINSIITTSGGLTVFTRNQPIEMTIQNCLFSSNAASHNSPNNTSPILYKTKGHGGAIQIHLARSSESQVTIRDCTFEYNQAEVDGGAIYVSMSEYSNNNILTFRDNHFINNTVLIASGGAVSINSFNFTFNNDMLVEGCTFSGNYGNSGGAFSLALYNSFLNSTHFPDSLTFRNCSFLENSALNEGTAVGLFSLVHVDQVGFPVLFEDCMFVNNTSQESREDASAITAFRFPTVFAGYNTFIENIGGGITLLNTQMEVMANSTLLFLRNRAVFGGGIAMDDRCLLVISYNVNMTFQENIAMESGGGIYVEFPPIRFVVEIFNRLCFLQYNNGSGIDAPPQEWNNVTINFTRNRARLSGAAIFASDMQQCSWLGSDFTSENSLIFDPPMELREIYPNYPFQYSNNELFPEGENVALRGSLNRNLATSPANIHVLVDYTLVQPGETLQIDLLATDQVNNSREAIWSVEAPAQEPNLDALSANNGTYPYIVPPADKLPGALTDLTSNDSNPVTLGDMNQMPSTDQSDLVADFVILENFSSFFTLNFSLLRTLGTVQPLELNVLGCHPGYYFDQNTKTCKCDSANYAHVLRCDGHMRYLYLMEGTWGGMVTVDGIRTLITTRVQPGYVQCDSQGRLPGCLFKFDNVDAQCKEGRKGNFCGECTANRGVTLDLKECSSGSCYAGLVLFLFLCVAVVIVSMLILVFDVGVPNELKGFLFYAQVVGLIYSPYFVLQTDVKISKYANVIRTLLNLLGQSVPIPLCISTEIKAHYVSLLGYISPTIVIFCMVLFVLGTRFIRALGSHSALQGITFLFLFVYKYLADTAFIFLSCHQTDIGLVFQYDGSQLCTAPEFAVFSIIGGLLVMFYVVPTPLVISYICIRRPQHFQHYADVLTKGLRTKHHWWGGWDIGRRLPFVFIGYYLVFLRPSIVLFLMSLAALLVLIVHLFTKPFKKVYINVIEAMILLNLLMVTISFLDPSNSPVPFGFSIALVLLPYAYALGYLLYLAFGRRLWKKFLTMRSQDKLKEKTAPSTDIDGALTAADTNPSLGDKKSESTDGASNSEGQANQQLSLSKTLPEIALSIVKTTTGPDVHTRRNQSNGRPYDANQNEGIYH